MSISYGLVKTIVIECLLRHLIVQRLQLIVVMVEVINRISHASIFYVFHFPMHYHILIDYQWFTS